MSRRTAHRSLLEQIADLQDPAPRDLDPEEDHNPLESDDSSSERGNTNDGRNHYLEINESSSLRQPNDLDLNSRYQGSSIGRNAFGEDEEEEESWNPFGSNGSQDSTSANESEDGAEKNKKVEALDVELSDGGKWAASPFSESSNALGSKSASAENKDSDMSDEDVQLSTSSSSVPAPEDRAALKKMMADEQKTVAASLNAAAKADVEKGNASKQQRQAFDSLLNVRIKLQKALISTNTIAASEGGSGLEHGTLFANHAEIIEKAEKAAAKLWTSLSTLREQQTREQGLPEGSVNRTSSSLPNLPDPNATHAQLWKQMIAQESTRLPKRRATLTKWSQRTNPITTLRPQNRFSQVPVQQPLTSILDRQLTGDSLSRGIKKTQTARSCAPIQASSSKHAVEDPSIYDDADFYTLLLRELVDRRMTDPSNHDHKHPTSNGTSGTADLSNALLRSSLQNQKVKKVVDTKASKGRKMRYTIHEKLQNFTAPEDRNTWGERQRKELFASLFGRKIDLVEEMEGMEGSGDERGYEERIDSGGDDDAVGLRLFG